MAGSRRRFLLCLFGLLVLTEASHGILITSAPRDSGTNLQTTLIVNSKANEIEPLLCFGSPIRIDPEACLNFTQAVFGPPFISIVFAPLVQSPTDLCSNTNDEELAGKIVLVERGGCNYRQKARNAQDNGALGIIYFLPPDMEGLTTPFGGLDGVDISAVLISASSATALLSFNSTEDTYISFGQFVSPSPTDTPSLAPTGIPTVFPSLTPAEAPSGLSLTPSPGASLSPTPFVPPTASPLTSPTPSPLPRPTSNPTEEDNDTLALVYIATASSTAATVLVFLWAKRRISTKEQIASNEIGFVINPRSNYRGSIGGDALYPTPRKPPRRRTGFGSKRNSRKEAFFLEHGSAGFSDEIDHSSGNGYAESTSFDTRNRDSLAFSSAGASAFSLMAGKLPMFVRHQTSADRKVEREGLSRDASILRSISSSLSDIDSERGSFTESRRSDILPRVRNKQSVDTSKSGDRYIDGDISSVGMDRTRSSSNTDKLRTDLDGMFSAQAGSGAAPPSELASNQRNESESVTPRRRQRISDFMKLPGRRLDDEIDESGSVSDVEDRETVVVPRRRQNLSDYMKLPGRKARDSLSSENEYTSEDGRVSEYAYESEDYPPEHLDSEDSGRSEADFSGPRRRQGLADFMSLLGLQNKDQVLRRESNRADGLTTEHDQSNNSNSELGSLDSLKPRRRQVLADFMDLMGLKKRRSTVSQLSQVTEDYPPDHLETDSSEGPSKHLDSAERNHSFLQKDSDASSSDQSEELSSDDGTDKILRSHSATSTQSYVSGISFLSGTVWYPSDSDGGSVHSYHSSSDDGSVHSYHSSSDGGSVHSYHTGDSSASGGTWRSSLFGSFSFSSGGRRTQNDDDKTDSGYAPENDI